MPADGQSAMRGGGTVLITERKRLCGRPCYQHPDKAVVEAKLTELDGLWTDLNAQAKVCRQHLNAPTCPLRRLTALSHRIALAGATQAKREQMKEAANTAFYFRLLDDLERWLKEVEAALATDDVGKDLASVQVRTPPAAIPTGGHPIGRGG